MFKYVLFDLDGTLTDSSEGITKSTQFALAQQGINEPDLKKLNKFIGPPLNDSFMRFYGMNAAQADRAVDDFRKRYAPIGIYENQIYPGIADLLKELKDRGVRLMVASSKPEDFVHIVLKNFNIRSYFDVISGSPPDESDSSKEQVLETALWMMISLEEGMEIDLDTPRPVPDTRFIHEREELEEALDRHGINKNTCAMVGDRKFDMLAANEYGLAAIGAGYGFPEKGELEMAGADAIAKNTGELLKILTADNIDDIKKKEV